MILTDREIAIALDTKQVIIEPRPPEDLLSSTAIDLRLHRSLKKWSPKKGMVIYPGGDEYSYNEIANTLCEVFDIGTGYILKPKTFILGWTKEEVSLPSTSRLAARVEGKSSLARLGIGIHVTAPTIHAGFQGLIQLEIYNCGDLDIGLQADMKICQLIFEQTLGTPDKGYRGIFTNQGAN
ncbi:dCTP deaminase [uncultured Gammaproteobacteria bacterium]